MVILFFPVLSAIKCWSILKATNISTIESLNTELTELLWKDEGPEINSLFFCVLSPF